MHLYRAFINQPSTLQPLHSLHGRTAIAQDLGGDSVQLHFTEGAVESMEAPRLSISRQFLCEAHRQSAEGRRPQPRADDPTVQVYRAALDRGRFPALPADLDGTQVIVADDGADSLTVHFTVGDTHSMVLPRYALARRHVAHRIDGHVAACKSVPG